MRDLEDVRSEVNLPVLRKDFTLSMNDVLDARCMGADAVLLIAGILSDLELRDLSAAAESVELETLVEVHNEMDLERALAANPQMIGVNQRDLSTFEVDRNRALKLHEAIPIGITSVAESGIRSHADLERLATAGFDAVLVGEALVVSDYPVQALLALRGKRLSMQDQS